jgi:hypothetical protein
LSQRPQLFGSVLVLTQTPLHIVSEGPQLPSPLPLLLPLDWPSPTMLPSSPPSSPLPL